MGWFINIGFTTVISDTVLCMMVSMGFNGNRTGVYNRQRKWTVAVIFPDTLPWPYCSVTTEVEMGEIIPNFSDWWPITFYPEIWHAHMLEKCFAFQVRNVYATFRSFKPFKTPLLIGDWGPGLLGIKMNQTHQSGEPINQPVFVIRPALEVRKDWMGRIVQHSARLDLLR